MNKIQFRERVNSIQLKNTSTKIAVKYFTEEFLKARISWYNKLEGNGRNTLKHIMSDCDFCLNFISAKFGDTFGIESKTMSLGILREVRNSKQRSSIKKSGKHRRTM